jgi:hypothetical protein
MYGPGPGGGMPGIIGWNVPVSSVEAEALHQHSQRPGRMSDNTRGSRPRARQRPSGPPRRAGAVAAAGRFAEEPCGEMPESVAARAVQAAPGLEGTSS